MTSVALPRNDWLRSILRRIANQRQYMQQYGVGNAVVNSGAQVYGARAIAPAGPATIVNCTFNAPDGTLLTAYPWTDPADVRPGGNQWVEYVGGFKCVGNFAVVKAEFSARPEQVIETGYSTGITLMCDAYFGTSATSWQSGFIIRALDSNNYWKLCVIQTAGFPIAIIERTGGIDTNRAGGATGAVVGNWYTMTAVLTGNIMSLTVNGVMKSYTSAQHVANTKHGMRGEFSAGWWRQDNFKVTVP